MPERIVVSNTSPLLYLHQIGQLPLLRDLYGEILVPLAVRDELLKGQALGISVPVISDLAWVVMMAPSSSDLLVEMNDLGAGEAEAIGLALSLPGALLLLDDSQGRAVAERRGIELTGTIGVLIKAKKKGLLPEVKPLLEKLRETSMNLSPVLLRRALQLAGES